MKKDICIVAVMAKNRVIGMNNAMPWQGQMRSDMARFKKLTLGHAVVMGKKTYESIGGPLPGRKIVILSHQALEMPDGVVIAHSLDEALSQSNERIFVAGGGNVYRQTLAHARTIYLTLIHAEFAGDSFFPEIDDAWEKTYQKDFNADGSNAWDYSFLTYRRRDP